MKTFFNLIQEVQKPGFCHRCGGCVTFCTAINYGALEIDDDGKPRYSEPEKCIECGLCYSVCPEITALEEEVKRITNWSAPTGRILDTTVARTTNKNVHDKATDGGVVTSLLMHLIDRGKIDGAITTKQVGPFQRKPFLCVSKEEIIDSAGFFFDTVHGMKNFSEQYITNSSVHEFPSIMKKGLHRVAFVGTPCQINAIRRMQALGIVPSDDIVLCLGLFCSGNFVFNDKAKKKISDIAGFKWDDVKKINIKEDIIINLKNGTKKKVPLEMFDSFKRYACNYCMDYSSEFADISFGGIGADEGWTTVLTRTPLGRAIISDAKSSKVIEIYDHHIKADFASHALDMIRKASSFKRTSARINRRKLVSKSVEVIG